MRHAHTSRCRPAPRPLARPAFTFICTCCETVEHARTPALPAGWATETIGDHMFAYCGDCAVDLPCRPEQEAAQ